MIWLKQYDGIVFEDMGVIFKMTNVHFYKHITSIGLDLNLSNKDQQKIYLHFFIINICKIIQTHNDKIVFCINTFNISDLYHRILKKVKSIFGIRIWESPYDLSTLIVKLKERDVEVIDKFEMFLEKEGRPKTFKHIKKFLDKEGFTQLSDSYFKDLVNKMAILY